jgi:sec-independent protein translocase protein TatC
MDVAQSSYSVLVIFIVAAIMTPTADILNMCLFAAPMMALYAISIQYRRGMAGRSAS